MNKEAFSSGNDINGFSRVETITRDNGETVKRVTTILGQLEGIQIRLVRDVIHNDNSPDRVECRKCTIHANGTETCVVITCPVEGEKPPVTGPLK